MQGKAARDDPEIPDPIGFSEHSYQNIEKCEIKDGQKLIKIDIRGCNRNPASNGYGDLRKQIRRLLLCLFPLAKLFILMVFLFNVCQQHQAFIPCL